MRKILTTLAVAASLIGGGAVATSANAQPVRYWGGHNHCWYGNGWHGPGWYWCGYANRRGYGWGGPAGWNGWGGGGVAVRVGPVGVRVGGPIVGVGVGRRVWGGRNYCWTGNGWHGQGWYQCGYENRRGQGWGGPRGWNRWDPDRDRD